MSGIVGVQHLLSSRIPLSPRPAPRVCPAPVSPPRNRITPLETTSSWCLVVSVGGRPASANVAGGDGTETAGKNTNNSGVFFSVFQSVFFFLVAAAPMPGSCIGTARRNTHTKTKWRRRRPRGASRHADRTPGSARLGVTSARGRSGTATNKQRRRGKEQENQKINGVAGQGRRRRADAAVGLRSRVVVRRSPRRYAPMLRWVGSAARARWAARARREARGAASYCWQSRLMWPSPPHL